MPKKLERKLAKKARQRGYGRARTQRYVFGGMRRAGWKPKREKGQNE